MGLRISVFQSGRSADSGVCAVRMARWVVCMDPPCFCGKYLRRIMLCNVMVGVSKSVTGIIRLLYWVAFVGWRPSSLVGRCGGRRLRFGGAALSLCRGCLLHITSDLINPFARILISHSRRCCRLLVSCRRCCRLISWQRSGGVPGGCGGCTLLRFPSGFHFALLHPHGCCLFDVSSGRCVCRCAAVQLVMRQYSAIRS